MELQHPKATILNPAAWFTDPLPRPALLASTRAALGELTAH